MLGLEPLGRGSGAGLDQPPLVPGLEMLGKSYKVIYGWLLLCWV